LVAVLALSLGACSTGGKLHPSEVAEVVGDAVPEQVEAAEAVEAAEVLALPACGDGVKDPGESCLTCPQDSPCACGDGVCSFGETSALAACPGDCATDLLAATPPMGWNSWNHFWCDIDEAMVRQMADTIVSSGLKDAGYRYVNLDDCWQSARDADGTILADPARFPGGIKALADYVHGLGLKLGLYTCAGTLTCQEKPGSYQYEAQDMQSYADWEVDYVKVDWCFTKPPALPEQLDAREAYGRFRDGIQAAGRPMVLSICNWGEQDPWTWGPATGQLWRTSGDIADVFFSAMANGITAANRAAYAGPGHWNDPDMLETGNGGMTPDEYRAHLGLWAVLAAPFIAGNDLRAMDADTLALLTDPEVLAIDQDPLGRAGVRLSSVDARDVWARPLARGGARAVLLLNRSFTPAEMGVKWSDLGLEPEGVSVRDVWLKQDLGAFDAGYSPSVPPHAGLLLLVQGRDALPPAGESRLGDLPRLYGASVAGPIERDRSAGGLEAGDGQPLSIRGVKPAHGLGVQASSALLWALGGRCTRLTGGAGVDDQAGGAGTVRFQVLVDGVEAWDSGLMTGADAARSFEVALAGAQRLELFASDAGDDPDHDLADWVDLTLTCQ
jgi:alpha-galactosidase